MSGPGGHCPGTFRTTLRPTASDCQPNGARPGVIGRSKAR